MTQARLTALSARELVSGVREKRWSASDVVRAHTDRIAMVEPQVRAWEHLAIERAMTRARDLDSQGTDGLLKGLPLAVKDIIDVVGMPTRFGSRVYASAVAARESAECVQALEHAGAIVLGKSVTTEFAYYAPGKTRNPWNVSHTPGGSSMGSAASVACGMAAAALGTQTNGSVIRPAAFCGVVGFKPSLGLVSNHGTLDPWPTLDHTGVFARSVIDAALVASVMARTGSISCDVATPESAPRLALIRSPVWDLASEAQKDMLFANADTLRAARAMIDDVPLPKSFDDAHRVQRLIMAYEAARHFEALQRDRRADLSARFNELLDEGARVSAADYAIAIESMQKLRNDFASFIGAYDGLITPPAPGEAPGTLEETGNPTFCTIWTLLGVPAITIPVGLGPAGLPLGLQIVGASDSDNATLAIAAWCESRLPFTSYAARR